MNKYTQKKGNFEYIRISKKRAKTLFDMGFRILAIPCKMRIGTPWVIEHEMQYTKGTNKVTAFINMVDTLTYYNCGYSMGYYMAFYIPVFNSLHFSFTDGSNPYFALNRGHDEIIKEVAKWARNWDIKQNYVPSDTNCFYATLTEKTKGARA